MSRDIYKTYFSHDIYSRQDPKIKDMLVHFRKESEQKAQAAYCIFWWIVEDMHADNYPVNKLDVFADDYRCDVDFLKSILEDFNLFEIENDCYISKRVLKNIKEQEEKHKKAKTSAYKRWQKQNKQGEDEPKEEIDENLINSIIDIFNEEFKKTQIVGKENREKIYKITKDNSLNIDIWKKVFENAKRGWVIKGEKKKPSLKTILDEWDSFASDDYYLAPDTRKNLKAKQEEKRLKEEQEEIERAEIEKAEIEKALARKSIKDKDSAINFLNRFYKFNEKLLIVTSEFQKLAKEYNFSSEEVIKARANV